jgi:nucleotide-binding universal stress UspA family protein
MRKILVPTDFSANALTSLKFAVPFAAHYQADIVLAHVLQRPTLPANSPLEVYETVMQEEQQHAWQELKQQIATVQQEVPKANEIRIIPVVNSNPFVTGVVQLVAQENASLIIMGTKGATGLKRVLVGSNTTDLISRAIVPLLAVPEKAQFGGMKKIVIAVDLKTFDGTESLHALRSIIRVCVSTVTVLTVHQRKESLASRKEEVKAMVEDMLEVLTEWVELKSNNPYKAIHAYVVANVPDLLVVMPQPKNVWQQLLSGSLTYEVLFKPEIPVLVVPALNAVE